MNKETKEAKLLLETKLLNIMSEIMNEMALQYTKGHRLDHNDVIRALKNRLSSEGISDYGAEYEEELGDRLLSILGWKNTPDGVLFDNNYAKKCISEARKNECVAQNLISGVMSDCITKHQFEMSKC